MPQNRECEGDCDNPAIGTFDFVESAVGERGLEFPERRNVPFCADCAGEAVTILINNGSFLSLRQAARFV